MQGFFGLHFLLKLWEWAINFM